MPSSSLIWQTGGTLVQVAGATAAYVNVSNQFHIVITNSDICGRIMHVVLVKTKRRPCISNREVIYLVSRCVQLRNGVC